MQTKANKSAKTRVENTNKEEIKNLIFEKSGAIGLIAMVFMAGIGTTSASDEGLAAYWSFDYGTATDETGNNLFETLVSKDRLV